MKYQTLDDIRPPVKMGQLRRWILDPVDLFFVVDVPEDEGSEELCTILEAGTAKIYTRSAIVYQSAIVSDTKS